MELPNCSGRENSYFGLARNFIRHLISPNQDDLSYSARTLKKQTQYFMLQIKTYS